MSKPDRSFPRKILSYLAIWTIFTGGLFSFLRWHYQKNFSEALYEEMLTATSKRRPLVDSPCLFAILGDPVTAGDNFSRVYFYCTKEGRATNSFDLAVLKKKNYRSLLAELGRINGFLVEFPELGEVVLGNLGSKKWACFVDGRIISDFDIKIQPKALVECFYDYSTAEVRNHYAKK